MKEDYLQSVLDYNKQKVKEYLDGGIGDSINSDLNRKAYYDAIQMCASEIVKLFLDRGAFLLTKRSFHCYFI